MVVSEIVTMQAEIVGYFGQAVNLRAMLDPSSGFIIISDELAQGERVPGALMVTNDPRGERDRLFVEEAFQDAIRQFYSAKHTGLLEIMSAVAKHDPQARIQTAGFNESGTRYELSPDTTNGNVAILALVNAATITLKANDAMDMGEEMAAMFLSI
jgi:hypothetical protein